MKLRPRPRAAACNGAYIGNMHVPSATPFDAAMADLVRSLHCDRCFLYARDPARAVGAVVACWSDPATGDWLDLRGPAQPEPADLAQVDPLMGLAFRSPDAVYVEDIETAGPDVLSLEFERDLFGHRALVHAPITADGQLFGILEPCVFGAPRTWDASDRAVIEAAQVTLSPLVANWVRSGALTGGAS